MKRIILAILLTICLTTSAGAGGLMLGGGGGGGSSLTCTTNYPVLGTGQCGSAAVGSMIYANTGSFAPASGIALTALANQAADTILANDTAGSAAPEAVAISASQIVGRTAASRVKGMSVAEASAVLGLRTDTATASHVPYIDGSGNVVNATYLSDVAYITASSTDELTNKTLTGEKEKVVTGGTCSTTYNLTAANGGIVTLTLNGACNIVPATPVAGQAFVIQLTQSSTVAPTFDSSMKWSGATQPTWSTSSTKYDMVGCTAFGTSAWWCNGLVDIR